MPIFWFCSAILHLALAGVMLIFTELSLVQAPVSHLPISATVWTEFSKKTISSAVPPFEKGGLGGIFQQHGLAENMQGKSLRRTETPAKQTLEDVLYLESWKRKVETIGNLNYPAAAQKLGLSGSLKLRVVIHANGRLGRTEVLFSSGEPILDQAALRIVRLAAPFAPFPPRMRKNKEMIEIIRTWQFLDSRNLVSL